MKKLLIYILIASITFIVLIFTTTLDRGIEIKPITQISVLLDKEKLSLEGLVVRYPKLRIADSKKGIVEVPENDVHDIQRLLGKTEGVLSISVIPARFHFSYGKHLSAVKEVVKQYTKGNFGEIVNIYSQKMTPLKDYLIIMIFRTLRYFIPALISAIILGVFISVLSSLNKGIGRIFDSIHKVLLCIPDYIFIVLLQLIVIYISKFGSNRIVLLYQLNNEIPFLIPFLAICSTSSLLIYGTLRIAINREFTMSYVVTAYSKGLSKFQIIINHILRNTLEDLLTIMPRVTFIAVGCTVMVEAICQIMGLGGYYFFRGIQQINTMPITCMIYTLLIWICNIFYSFISKKYIYSRKGGESV